MKTYLVNALFFEKNKAILNEKCFWREHPKGIEIKLITALKKHIPTHILTVITQNPLNHER